MPPAGKPVYNSSLKWIASTDGGGDIAFLSSSGRQAFHYSVWAVIRGCMSGCSAIAQGYPCCLQMAPSALLWDWHVLLCLYEAVTLFKDMDQTPLTANRASAVSAPQGSTAALLTQSASSCTEKKLISCLQQLLTSFRAVVWFTLNTHLLCFILKFNRYDGKKIHSFDTTASIFSCRLCELLHFCINRFQSWSL